MRIREDMQVIAQGAEATLTKGDGKITKERIRKGYRLKEIDAQLRKKRTRNEIKLMREARRAGAAVPQIMEEGDFSICMESVDGGKVKDIMGKNCAGICGKIGEAVAKMHKFHIIHGDLTTSNMLLKGDAVFFIDFGLGFFSQRDEDKAVDLHLLRQVLDSTHTDIAESAWEIILNAYRENYPESAGVFAALGKIEKRGRYRER